MRVLRSFEIRRLRPFHREGDCLPEAGRERSEELASLDPDLRPEEESYVSHYLNYADVLLNESQEDGSAKSPSRRSSDVIGPPTIQEQNGTEEDEDEKAA